MTAERTPANWRERLPQLDKLGVTGSSPVPPIEKALLKGFFVVQEENGWSDCGKDRSAKSG
jgi:hypothetical protein